RLLKYCTEKIISQKDIDKADYNKVTLNKDELFYIFDIENQEDEIFKNIYLDIELNRVMFETINLNLYIYKSGERLIVNPISNINFDKKTREMNITLCALFVMSFIESKNNMIMKKYDRFPEVKDEDCATSEKNETFEVYITRSECDKLKKPYGETMLMMILEKLHEDENKLNEESIKTITKSTITVDELKEKLINKNEKTYDRYCDFKKRVLVPTIESMKNIGFDIDFREIKENKKVESIEFSIKY
ncbi:MAG: replication initiation protein, partial [Romboutsia sp.]|nr:replication initiation protein [Romboutsia sp.]